MKKTAIVMLTVLVVASVATLAVNAALRDTPALGRPYLQVELVYNYEVYQRPLFFLPKSQPTFSIWIEENDSGYCQSIFVTEKAARNSWHFADSRPESIPVWYGIQQIEKENRMFDIDAVSGATPKGNNAIIYWSVPKKFQGKAVNLYIEANNSFDFNKFYHRKKGAPGYSGANGQPSVIWKAGIDFANAPIKNITPELIGHGNVFGEDHRVVSDTSKITTAAQTFQSIRISYFLQ